MANYQPLSGYAGGEGVACTAAGWTGIDPVVGLAGGAAVSCRIPGCVDNSTWRSRLPSAAPYAGLAWTRCANTWDESGLVAASDACAVTCGTCEFQVGLPAAAPCTDDPAWVDTRGGYTCLSVAFLAPQRAW